MKQIISILFVITFSVPINSYAQKRYHLLEEYYNINSDGEIDTLTIKEKRSYTFDNNLFVSGQTDTKGITTKLDSYIDKYNSLLNIENYNSYTDKNEQGVVTTQIYLKNQQTHKHEYNYNLWGDIIEDKLIIYPGDTTLFTYEYYYLPEFTYATNSDGVTAISGYKYNYKSLWLRKTVKRDGSIIESVNRRISTLDNRGFSSIWEKFLKAIGYGPTIH